MKENKGKEPLRVITRAQSKLAHENTAKTEGSQTPREHTSEPKQKQVKMTIGPTTSDPILQDTQGSEGPVNEETERGTTTKGGRIQFARKEFKL